MGKSITFVLRHLRLLREVLIPSMCPNLFLFVLATIYVLYLKQHETKIEKQIHREFEEGEKCVLGTCDNLLCGL